MSDENNSQTIRDLVAGLSEVSTAEDGAKPFTILPSGYNVHDLEKTLRRPLSVRANPVFLTLAGLIGYIVEFKLDETAIFANPETGAIKAILDYHGLPDVTDRASWCQHTASYAPEHTIEWNRWKTQDNKWLAQRVFAEFIEENVDDVSSPAGATMLEIAQTLESKTATDFKSGVRLDSGSHRLTFNTEVTSRAGEKGDIDIPNTIVLAIAPFRGGDAYPLVARFRYRVNDGKLELRYQLVNPHKVIEAAVQRMIDVLTTGTSITPFLGIP
jgi:uncharacterized protein YfdQ (DUF2303 family)